MMKRTLATLTALTLSLGFAQTTFNVSVENTSPTEIIQVSGQDVIPALSPGVWVVHTSPAPLFKNEEPDYGEGLEAVAEDGFAAELGDALAALVAAMESRMGGAVKSAAAFTALNSTGEPGAALTGDGFAFSFQAEPGDLLSLATMFGDSNDLFFAPAEQGVPLFAPDGTPLSGDITSYLILWDAGTEVNEGPGGPNQAPRQSGPDTGETETGVVRVVNDGYIYPLNKSWVKVSITPVN